MSPSSPSHEAMAEVPFSALKPHSVLKKCLETSAAPSARGQGRSIAHVTIMSVSVSIRVHRACQVFSLLGSLYMSQSGREKEMARIRTAGLLKPVQQVKVREFLLSQWRVLIRTSICKGLLKLKLSGSKPFRQRKHLSFLSYFITKQNETNGMD